MTPKEVIQKWVDAFNEGNVEKISEFYHDDAINHQVTNAPVVGKLPSKTCLPMSLTKPI